MYAALVARRIGDLRRNLWRIAVMRSGLLTMMVVTIALLGLAFGWSAHRQGRFSRLKQELKQEPSMPQPSVAARPGGQDAIVLQRTRLEGQDVPEFLTATVLPGRGMNVLQITAYLPHKGEVSLLASPNLDEAAQLLTGSVSMGGGFEAPWANRISGAASADGKNLTTAGWASDGTRSERSDHECDARWWRGTGDLRCGRLWRTLGFADGDYNVGATEQSGDGDQDRGQKHGRYA